jgi:hypothetical protein
MPPFGWTPSPDTKERMRLGALRRWSDPHQIELVRQQLTGRVATAETRAKMSASHRTHNLPESNEKTRQALLGKALSLEHREKLRQAKLRNPVRYWQGKDRPSPTEETRAKMSATKKGRAKPETFNPHIKRPNPYNGLIFRSSYEVRVARALDSLGIKWVYEPKRFDLGTCRYKPDFYLPDQDVFWEVKGWFSPDSQRKVSLFRSQYPDIPLIVFPLSCIVSLEAAAKKAA